MSMEDIYTRFLQSFATHKPFSELNVPHIVNGTDGKPRIIEYTLDKAGKRVTNVLYEGPHSAAKLLLSNGGHSNLSRATHG